MSDANSMDSHQADNSQNYITVIPVEYPRSRVYPQAPDYLVDQYRYSNTATDIYAYTLTVRKQKHPLFNIYCDYFKFRRNIFK
jgi:hypothetical protein